MTKPTDEAKMPEEPEVFWIPIEDGTHPVVDLQDYRNLRAYAQQQKDRAVEAEKREQSKHQQYTALKERHDKLVEQFTKLEADNAALRKDAERYRWLRDKGCGFETGKGSWKGDVWNANEFLDAAIDVAAKERK